MPAIDHEIRSANIPAPEDTPYPGVIQIHVDASNTRQGIFYTHQIIPVTPGRLTLYYPKWLPGKHSPVGPIASLAGVTILASGKELTWQRNQYDVYSFQVEIPEEITEIEVDLQYLSARSSAQGPTEMTSKMLNLNWDKVSLYPAGHYTRQIQVQASLKLPQAWDYGSALREKSRSDDNTIHFQQVSYNVLVDSPLYAGKHVKKLDLAPEEKVPVILNLFGDTPQCLEVSEEQLGAHRQLVSQMHRLFGSTRHYAHYDFLLSVSDYLSTKGVEHHQSSENGHPANYFSDWANGAPRRDLLAHEFTHSWNGKFRRPADNWTPNFNVAMGDSLLWVYEGQTQYWGYIVTARSGMWTPQQYRDALAQVVAGYDRGREGFAWRGIADTTNDPTIAMRRPKPYLNWQMREEYYNAGQLLWLWTDVKIRELTNNEKSLDDFAREFFGTHDGRRPTKTYVYQDVVEVLNSLVSYDWDNFLHKRVTAKQAPLAGVTKTGWQLCYKDTPSEYESQFTARYHSQPSFLYSIGLSITKSGQISDVRWNGPAYQAGISSGEVIVAINGQAFKNEVLTQALKNAAATKKPIELLLKFHDEFRSIKVEYYDGPQYPHLERIEGTTDYLSEIIAAKKNDSVLV